MKAQSHTMSQKDIVQVAKIAALTTINGVREQITDMVRYEMVPTTYQKQYAETATPRYRTYAVKMPPPKSDYSIAIMASAKWRAGKGAMLGSAWMHKGSQWKILICQYGNQCSILRMNLAVKKAKFDSANQMVEAGNSPWTDHAIANGTLEDVVAMQKGKGWILVTPEPKQLSLVDDVGGA